MKFEVWTPETPDTHEQYDAVEDLPRSELKDESARREEIFTGVLRKYAALRNEGSRKEGLVGDSRERWIRVGQMMGDAYVRLHQAHQLAGATPEQLRRIHTQVINMAPSAYEGRTMLSGALTQIGVLEALKEIPQSEGHAALEGMKVYHPSEDEDVEWGVDALVHMPEDNLAMALQVKTLPLRENARNKIVYPFRTLGDVDDLLTGLLIPNNLYAAPGEYEQLAESLRQRIRDSMERQITYASNYTNVVPALVAVPSPEGEGSLINPVTGVPQPELVERLGECLEEVRAEREFYLSDPYIEMAA
jgi:hypothetical protein